MFRGERRGDDDVSVVFGARRWWFRETGREGRRIRWWGLERDGLVGMDMDLGVMVGRWIG